MRATLMAGFARRDLIPAALLALALAASGAVTAWIWSVLAPRVQVVMTAEGPVLRDIHTEDWVAGDMAYGLIVLVAGLAAGLIAYSLRRWRGPTMLLALMVGSLAGAVICAWLGPTFDAEAYRRLVETAPVGRQFGRPADLRATGLVLVQPMAAVISYVVCAAWSRSPDLS
ncbi:MAG TPA: hypothetical protein VGR21_08115 [Cryptosporangiaceae bacterium]|nr:hypothetical protein [Cryptosporangiaceae bacterium]